MRFHTQSLTPLIVMLSLVSISLLPESFAQSNPPPSATVQKGIAFLREKGQASDGTFSSQAGPGVTALVVTALLRHQVPLKDPTLAKGLAALESFVKPDGGIYGNGRLKNYETCVAILAFSEANRVAGDARYQRLLADAKKFLLTMQYGETSGENPSDPAYGGAGYAGKGRPDLSNTAYFLEALQALDSTGLDPAVQRALVFVSRCQNLQSEFNPSPLAAKVNDGGFFYTVPKEEDVESNDKDSPSGGLRSSGSMTYSGLKSMIYAGLTPEDPRVKAATEWIAKHYSLSENPGMGKAGLFYYFHTFSAAWKASGQEAFTDDSGTQHHWRKDLHERLTSIQNDDGSWNNENRQWFEEDKNLCTAFALLALAY